MLLARGLVSQSDVSAKRGGLKCSHQRERIDTPARNGKRERSISTSTACGGQQIWLPLHQVERALALDHGRLTLHRQV
jgi:hypothetical protein